MTSHSRCKDCKFWDDDGHFGSCKRYPKIVSKHTNDWCGEFQLLEMITLPVLTEEFIVAEHKEAKKRGRPKNDK